VVQAGGFRADFVRQANQSAAQDCRRIADEGERELKNPIAIGAIPDTGIHFDHVFVLKDRDSNLDPVREFDTLRDVVFLEGEEGAAVVEVRAGCQRQLPPSR